jgi:UDP-glucose 4-epimerase
MILVTGGAGFIGTHLCRKLTQAGHGVRVIDLRDPENRIEGVEYVRGDVRDRPLLESTMSGIDVVYHFAATVSVPVCQKDPIDSYSNNFQSTLIVLEAIRKLSEGRPQPISLVFASTAALYGNRGRVGHALKESEAGQEFSSFYAAQKYASENAIGLYHRCYGIPAVAFRFFNVFGPGQDPTSPYSGVITVFARFAREGKALPLNGGGSQTRDFISVYDIARVTASALDMPLEKWDGRAMNLGTGNSITIRQLAEIIRDGSGKGSEITVAPPRDGDVLHSMADIGLARETLGFVPKTDLVAGLRELV